METAEKGDKSMKKALLVTLLLLASFCFVVSCNSEASRKVIGNVNTKVFHKESCSHLPIESNRIVFDNREAAVEAGYTACSICKP